MNDAVEVWKSIPGYESSYDVSSRGRVRSVARRVRLVVASGTECTRGVPARLLKPGPMRSGHLTVCLGKGNSKLVHSLVLLAFVGPRAPDKECLHLNHCPYDNRLENLKYGTRSENLKMDYDTGSRQYLKRGDA
jgi:hypothetical protein